MGDRRPAGPAELRAWIERSKLSDGEVARLLGISPPYLSQLLSGVRSPSLGLTGVIAELTGVPITAWMDRVMSTLSRRVG